MLEDRTHNLHLHPADSACVHHREGLCGYKLLTWCSWNIPLCLCRHRNLGRDFDRNFHSCEDQEWRSPSDWKSIPFCFYKSPVYILCACWFHYRLSDNIAQHRQWCCSSCWCEIFCPSNPDTGVDNTYHFCIQTVDVLMCTRGNGSVVCFPSTAYQRRVSDHRRNKCDRRGQPRMLYFCRERGQRWWSGNSIHILWTSLLYTSYSLENNDLRRSDRTDHRCWWCYRLGSHHSLLVRTGPVHSVCVHQLVQYYHRRRHSVTYCRDTRCEGRETSVSVWCFDPHCSYSAVCRSTPSNQIYPCRQHSRRHTYVGGRHTGHYCTDTGTSRPVWQFCCSSGTDWNIDQNTGHQCST